MVLLTAYRNAGIVFAYEAAITEALLRGAQTPEGAWGLMRFPVTISSKILIVF
jgi:hypothetical protein